jgi:hypothetical protein
MMLNINKIVFTIALILLVPSKINAESSDAKWVFNVLLNGKNIGEHQFVVSLIEDSYLQVESNANMRVSFLFFEAFKYQHQAVELWRNGCLESIKSEINNNNDVLVDNGMNNNRFFMVEAKKNSLMLEGCVRSFAYWDLGKILNSERLLNPQTGEYVEVEMIPGGVETVEVADMMWDATKYSLVGEKLHIDLWYGPDGEWLKLRSILKNNRELIYQLQSQAISI